MIQAILSCSADIRYPATATNVSGDAGTVRGAFHQTTREIASGSQINAASLANKHMLKYGFAAEERKVTSRIMI